MNTERPAKVTISYPYSGTTEAHACGCKAATRRVNRVQTDTRDIAFDTLIEILSNPDEGEIKVHACIRPAVKAAQ